MMHSSIQVQTRISGRSLNAFLEAIPLEEAPRAAHPVVERLARELGSVLDAGEAERLLAEAIRLALASRRPVAATDAPPHGVASGLPKWRLRRVFAYVEENLADAVTLPDLAAAAGLSRMYFAAQFRAATGLRPHDYVRRRRIERAKALLAETAERLVDVGLSVGFQTQAHFTTAFRQATGETPRRWRAAHSRLN